ncbi:MAG: DUF5802 family protein [archaeon]
MFERFSRSYYLGRLYVEPFEGSGAAISDQQHRYVHRHLYDTDTATGDGPPLVMKLGSRHFPVTGEKSLPADTLGVPPAILSDASVKNPPSLQEVLLATQDRAEQLLSIAGVTSQDSAGI